VSERTLVILKPDAVERGLVEQIVARFEETSSLKIIARKKLMATSEHLDKHFPITDDWVTDMGARARKRCEEELNLDPTERFGTESAYKTGIIIINGCREYYLFGPLVALVLKGPEAVKTVRKLIGNTMPSKAEPGTIRGDFGIHENLLGESPSYSTRNLVHASDSPEAAIREIACWFTPEEIVN